MLVSVGISWINQAEFSPNDRSLDFTCSQETPPADFRLCGISALWRQRISLQIHWQVLGYKVLAQGLSVLSLLLSMLSKRLWRCWGLRPCRSGSTWGTGMRRRRRRRKTSCHRPKLTLWKSGGEMVMPEAWNLCSTKRKIHYKNLSRRNPVVVDWPFFPPNKHLPRVVSWLVNFCNPLEGDAVAWHDQTPNTAERP